MGYKNVAGDAVVLHSHEDAHHVQPVVQHIEKQPLIHARKKGDRCRGNDLQRRMRVVLEPSDERVLIVDAQVGGVLKDERSGTVDRQREGPARVPHDGRLQRWQERLDETRCVWLRADEQDVRAPALEHAPVFSRYPEVGRFRCQRFLSQGYSDPVL